MHSLVEDKKMCSYAAWWRRDSQVPGERIRARILRNESWGRNRGCELEGQGKHPSMRGSGSAGGMWICAARA